VYVIILWVCIYG